MATGVGRSDSRAAEGKETGAETATTWDFTGKAVSGPLAGKQLEKIFVLKDYWFDWKIHHPDTKVYSLGE